MLRLERERVVEVGVEIGGALAGDPVDEIERNVVKTGITKMMAFMRGSRRTWMNSLTSIWRIRSNMLRPVSF